MKTDDKKCKMRTMKIKEDMKKWKYSSYIITWNCVNKRILQRLDMPVI